MSYNTSHNLRENKKKEKTPEIWVMLVDNNRIQTLSFLFMYFAQTLC